MWGPSCPKPFKVGGQTEAGLLTLCLCFLALPAFRSWPVSDEAANEQLSAGAGQ